MGSHKPGFSNRTIETTKGPITCPRATIPHKAICPQELTVKLAKVIGDRWACGGNFLQLADAVIDSLCHHIAKCSMEKMDPRISDAVEDHMSVEAKEGDADAEQEASIEDLNAMIEKVREDARVMKLKNWKGGAL